MLVKILESPQYSKCVIGFSEGEVLVPVIIAHPFENFAQPTGAIFIIKFRHGSKTLALSTLYLLFRQFNLFPPQILPLNTAIH